jgi:hypothetical protein
VRADAGPRRDDVAVVGHRREAQVAIEILLGGAEGPALQLHEAAVAVLVGLLGREQEDAVAGRERAVEVVLAGVHALEVLQHAQEDLPRASRSG